MLHKAIKNQNLEEEKDSIAFYDIQELGEGAFGTVNLITTNPVVVGTEVKIASPPWSLFFFSPACKPRLYDTCK